MRRARRSRELVPVDTKRCPSCSAAVEPHTLHEPALVRHGGYGATRRTTSLRCSADDCDWMLEREVTEVRPEKSTDYYAMSCASGNGDAGW